MKQFPKKPTTHRKLEIFQYADDVVLLTEDKFFTELFKLLEDFELPDEEPEFNNMELCFFCDTKFTKCIHEKSTNYIKPKDSCLTISILLMRMLDILEVNLKWFNIVPIKHLANFNSTFYVFICRQCECHYTDEETALEEDCPKGGFCELTKFNYITSPNIASEKGSFSICKEEISVMNITDIALKLELIRSDTCLLAVYSRRNQEFYIIPYENFHSLKIGNED